MLSDILSHCSNYLDYKLQHYKPLSGGDINEVYLVETDQQPLVVKLNDSQRFPAMFEREAAGLQALRQAKALAVPEVLCAGEFEQKAFLVLEYVPSGQANKDFWEHFGRQLAAIHQQKAAHFGGLPTNYIGALPQYNPQLASWPEFYAQARLQPQLKMAIERKVIGPQEAYQLEQLIAKLPDILEPASPSLIHGDLWNGNFLVDKRGQAVLVDPAACYASQEMDLAMTRLFGGFDAAFYAAYEEAWPLERGHKERVSIYQLYYLLVHLNLFGRSYWSAIKNSLKSYM